eukprot:7620110-Pyramimonas_sp.AAC.2
MDGGATAPTAYSTTPRAASSRTPMSPCALHRRREDEARPVRLLRQPRGTPASAPPRSSLWHHRSTTTASMR